MNVVWWRVDNTITFSIIVNVFESCKTANSQVNGILTYLMTDRIELSILLVGLSIRAHTHFIDFDILPVFSKHTFVQIVFGGALATNSVLLLYPNENQLVPIPTFSSTIFVRIFQKFDIFVNGNLSIIFRLPSLRRKFHLKKCCRTTSAFKIKNNRTKNWNNRNQRNILSRVSIL